MSNLSDSQLVQLDNLIYYMSNDKEVEKAIDSSTTIGEIVDTILNDPSNYIDNYKKNYKESLPAAMSADEWRTILTAIQSDPELCKYTITNYTNDPEGSNTYNFCAATIKNPDDPSDVNVIFRGTNGDLKEWTDNGSGGYKSETTYQQRAKDYIEEIYKKYGVPITVSGHSKGGNLSMYVAIMTDCVDRCVAVDGQGFSEEFIMENLAQIGLKRDNITLISASKDYVNLLLYTIAGNMKFIQTDSEWIPLLYHKPNIILDENGQLNPECEPAEFRDGLNNFTKYINSNVPDPLRSTLIDSLTCLLGEDVDGEMPKNFKSEGLKTGLKALRDIFPGYRIWASKYSDAQSKQSKFIDEHEFENEEAIRQYLVEHTGDKNPHYLVRGALLHCRFGSHARKLNLLRDHGVYVQECPLIHELNCETNLEKNISWFGVCKSPCPPTSETVHLTNDPPRDSSGSPTGDASGFVSGHKCEPFIVSFKWLDTHAKTRIVDNGDIDSVDRKKADDDSEEAPKGLSSVTTLSYLVCNWGGIIEPYNSGQEFTDTSVDSDFGKISHAADTPYAISGGAITGGTSINSPYANAMLNGEPLDDVTIKVIELLTNQLTGEENIKYNWDVIEEVIQSDMENFALEKYKALCYIYNSMSDANDIQRFLNAGFSISQIPEPPKPHTTAEGYSYWYSEQPQYQQAKNRYDYAQPGPVLQGMAAWYRNEEGFDGYSIEELERINLLRAACEAGGGTYVEKGHKPIQIEQGKNGFLLTVPSQSASPNLHILEVDKSGWSSKE